MENVSITNEEIIKWCDEMASKGKLSIRWDGGGDSGCVYVEFNGEYVKSDDKETQTVNKIIECLEEHTYNELDYGSWAGEFNANGEAVYDPEKKCFLGTDYYCETQCDDRNINYKVSLHPSIWFDEMQITVERDEDCVVAFNMANGFQTDKHESAIESISQSFDKVVNRRIQKANKDEMIDFTVGYNDFSIKRDDFVLNEKTGMLEYTIETITLEWEDVKENDVIIHLNQLNDDDDYEDD